MQTTVDYNLRTAKDPEQPQYRIVMTFLNASCAQLSLWLPTATAQEAAQYSLSIVALPDYILSLQAASYGNASGVESLEPILGDVPPGCALSKASNLHCIECTLVAAGSDCGLATLQHCFVGCFVTNSGLCTAYGCPWACELVSGSAPSMHLTAVA